MAASSSSNNNNSNSCGQVGGGVREQDQYMPIANVIRIMRRILPSHAKISDDAKETIQECVSEYISFITSEANDRCQREQRKTVTAEDVLWAMAKLGFDDYVTPLSRYLHRYRHNEAEPHQPLRRTAGIMMQQQQHSLPPPPLPPSAFGSTGGFQGGGGVFDMMSPPNASAMGGGPFFRDDDGPPFDPFAHIKRDRL